MTEQILRDQKLWLAGYDLTGAMNALAIEYAADVQERTALGDTTRTRLGGLKDVTAQHEGYFDADPTDAALFANVGLAQVPMSFAPKDAVEGSVAYSFLAAVGDYSPGGAVGDMFAFSVGAQADGDLIRGTLMVNAAKTATGNGTARQLGAVSAAQSVYAALHVTSVGGTTPTLDVTVESDDGAGFASPVTRITFDQATAIGAQWKSLAGAVTDDWWRVTWTLGGTSPDFTLALVLGIQ